MSKYVHVVEKSVNSQLSSNYEIVECDIYSTWAMAVNRHTTSQTLHSFLMGLHTDQNAEMKAEDKLPLAEMGMCKTNRSMFERINQF